MATCPPHLLAYPSSSFAQHRQSPNRHRQSFGIRGLSYHNRGESRPECGGVNERVFSGIQPMKAQDISSKAELYPTKLGRTMLKSVTEKIEEDRQCEGDDGTGHRSREFRLFSAAQRRGAPIKDL